MTLVDLLRKLGTVEVSLLFDDSPDNVVLLVKRGDKEAAVQADVVNFQTGGSIVMLHEIPEEPAQVVGNVAVNTGTATFIAPHVGALVRDKPANPADDMCEACQ